MNATFPPRREAGGFTLVELLVVIGIIALLISSLLPTLSRARDSAKAVKCGSNVRQIAQGLVGYGTEFNGTFPVGFGFLGYNGAYAEGTGDGPATVEMWVTAVSGYLNANRENDYNLPWLTSAISASRFWRISSSLKVSRSTPSSSTDPPSICPGGRIKRSSDSAMVDLPEPDSPIRPKRWPGWSVKLTSSTAFTGPRGVW